VTVVELSILPKPAAALAAANLFSLLYTLPRCTGNLQIARLAYLYNKAYTKPNRYRGRAINLKNENPMKCYATT
jgi:hypothetical protein